VLDVENKTVEIKEVHSEEAKPKKEALEEDSILFETPSISEGELPKRELSVEDQVVIQAHVNYI